MSYAHVDSVDALKQFRSALWKYAEAASQSLSEADSDLQRTLNWLEHEARTYWQGQIKRRTQALNLAKESLRSKLSITRRDGSKPSAIEEQKAVTLAQARLQNAVEKLENVRKYAKTFQREALVYRGLMQRFVSTIQVDVPDAVAHLDALVESLEQYTAIEEARSAATAAGLETPASSMRRPGQDEPAEPGRPEKPQEAGPAHGLPGSGPARLMNVDPPASAESGGNASAPGAPATQSDDDRSRPPGER